ncbi:hypothetical protein, partial [Mycobacterium ulcerans]|uniref:hypothetical protein n=1 Tax=Mycobacterium ulcerans TaxID=1809 RepID=UPI0021D7A047
VGVVEEGRQPWAPPLYSSAASEVYKRQVREVLVATAGYTSAVSWGQVGPAAMAGRVVPEGGSMATAAAVPADPAGTDSGRSVALAGPAGAVAMPG